MRKHLTHPNIVPLIGVTIDPFQLISDSMPGGDLVNYIASNPGADRLSLVSVPSTVLYDDLPHHQLSDAAEGLNYLHSRGVVHGYLKGVRSV